MAGLKRGEHVFIPFDAEGKAFMGSGKIRVFRSIEKAENVGFFADCLAEYAPVRHRRWVLQPGGTMYKCSECGYAAHPREVDEWRGCPNCLSVMEGGESDA